MNKPVILCVDDEPNVLSLLMRLLRKDYTVIMAHLGTEALEILRKNPDVAVAIIDQRMPEMSGVELMEQMTRDYPDVVKIVLTGYTDLSALIESINKGEVFRYIQKPWDESILRSAVASACLRFTEQKESRRLREALSATEAKLKKVMEELNFYQKKD